jgi:hypothetical protein
MTGESLILDPTGGGDVDVQGRMKVGRVRERQLVSALRAGGRERGREESCFGKAKIHSMLMRKLCFGGPRG